MKSNDKKYSLFLVVLLISFMFFKWGWHAGKEDRHNEQNHKVMSDN